jgi:hypothetical protein
MARPLEDASPRVHRLAARYLFPTQTLVRPGWRALA